MFTSQKIIKFLILLFCFSIFSSISQTNEDVPLNNMAISEIPRPISSVTFEDFTNREISLDDYKGKLVIINFWATWCAPCKKEMPSLDSLYQNSNFKNLEVLAVNMEQPNTAKTKKFFDDIKSELGKISWINKRDNVKSTLGVLLVTVILGLFLLLVDFIFSSVTKFLLGG